MDGKLRNMASIYIIHKDKILMLYRIGSRVVPPSWCGIGGHFEQGELNDAKKCMLRELSEEINLCENDISEVELRYITLRLKDNEVRQNYYFFAFINEGAPTEFICDEGLTEWLPIEKILDLDMPFTAHFVLKHYLRNGRYDNNLYGALASDNEVIFSILNEF